MDPGLGLVLEEGVRLEEGRNHPRESERRAVFAFWRIQTRVVRLDAKHFVDFVDFISSGLFCGARGGARAMTSCFFAGPGCRISVDVLRDEAQEIKGITTRGLSQ